MNYQTAAALTLDTFAAPTSTVNGGNQAWTNIASITVDKIYFANGGTNSWLTMSSTTSGVWRINGSNTIFNVTLGQE